MPSEQNSGRSPAQPPAAADFSAWVGSQVSVPPIPVVAQKVIELVNDPYVSASIVKKAIASDQTLAARVIRMANSAFYSPREPVSDMHQAVMVLGFNTIKEIVVGASLNSLYRNMGLVQKMMWDHSVAVAVGARIISHRQKVTGPEVTLVAGLLHDVGKVIMLDSAPERYQAVIERVYNDRISFREAERGLFGFDHTEVGALLVHKWNFSLDLGKVVQFHHRKDFAGIEPPEVGRLTAAVSLANLIALRAGLGYSRPDETVRLADSAAAAALRLSPQDLSEEACAALAEDIRASVDEEESIFL